jgi:hypothetical protein
MDRRKHQRVPFAHPIRLSIGDIDRFTTEYAADIGAGGIFLKMPTPLAEEEELDIEFFLEPVKKIIRTRARVVRSVPGSGMALEFIDLSKDTRRFIELVVGKYNRQHPSDPIEAQEEEPAPMRTFGVYIGLPEDEHLRCEHGHILDGGDIFVRSDRQWPRGVKVDLQILDPVNNQWIPAEGEILGALDSPGVDELTPGPGVAVGVRDPSDELLKILPSLAPAPAEA